MRLGLKRTLVVDNSHVFLMYIAILLKRMGFEVIPTDSGEEALKMFKMLASDLVILDTGLSNPDSWSVLEHMRETHVPVITVSDTGSEEERRQCEEAGCVGLLRKPIRIEKLHELLQECIFPMLGWKRRHLRVPYNSKVKMIHGGAEEYIYAESLSGGGIYLRKRNPLEVGSQVEIIIDHDDEVQLSLKGTVIYVKGLFGDVFKVPPGMAVEFREVPESTARELNAYVKRLIAGDIVELQEESVVSLD